MMMRARAAIVTLAAVTAGSVAGCGGHSGNTAGSGATTTTMPAPVAPTTPTTPPTTTQQAARANARCLLGSDAVSAILGAAYGAPRIQPSGVGKACQYQAANGSGHVVIILRLGASSGDFTIDRRQLEVSGTPTKDWSGVGDEGFTNVNMTEHSATAGALAGNAEIVASVIGFGSLGQAQDLVRAAIVTLMTG